MIATARIQRLHGHAVVPPRRWHLPGAALLRFLVGIWPATLTGVAAGALAVTTAL